jgi:thioredoxin 1
MNKFVIVVIVFATILGSSYFFLVHQKKDNLSTDLTASRNIQDLSEDSIKKSADSRYIEYSPESYELHKDKRRVLFFYANWCPTCRLADADFVKNISIIPEDTVVIRVNYNDSETDNNEKELAKNYAVTYQHTFVQINGHGNEVTKWNGGQTEDLLKNIK